MKIEAVLKNVFLFSELADSELKEVASVSSIKRVTKGKVIFEEGDLATHFFAVAHGSAKVFRINEDGTESILHVQKGGDLIAEAVLFGIKKYPASCSAIKESAIISIPKDGFVNLIMKNPRISIKFMAAYSHRLKEFVDKIESLSSSVEERLSNYLLENSKELSKGKLVCDLNISKKDLASLLGTSPETISRMLNRFTKLGYISVLTPKKLIINVSCFS